MYTRRLLAAFLDMVVAAPGVQAQPKPGLPDLPITRLVLFSSGVGYYQRAGRVEGSARIDLHFPAARINDLLKSLVLQDLDGGQVGAVSYDNRDPLQKTLKSFALDLTGNPSLADLLHQARGERVELLPVADKSPAGQAETLTGQVVGVEKQRQPAGKEQVIE